VPSYKAADRMAEERIASVAKSRNTFLRNAKSVYTR
jgi:leucine dehydrogenase